MYVCCRYAIVFSVSETDARSCRWYHVVMYGVKKVMFVPTRLVSNGCIKAKHILYFGEAHSSHYSSTGICLFRYPPVILSVV